MSTEDGWSRGAIVEMSSHVALCSGSCQGTDFGATGADVGSHAAVGAGCGSGLCSVRHRERQGQHPVLGTVGHLIPGQPEATG